MKMYLGAYLSNYNNTATPLVDWFDDEAWSQVALPGSATSPRPPRLLGFAGLALDQELYGQTGGVADRDLGVGLSRQHPLGGRGAGSGETARRAGHGDRARRVPRGRVRGLQLLVPR